LRGLTPLAILAVLWSWAFYIRFVIAAIVVIIALLGFPRVFMTRWVNFTEGKAVIQKSA
jgi:hypothetical protein